MPHAYPNQNIHYPYPYRTQTLLYPQLTIQIPVVDSVADSKTQVRIGNRQLVADS